MGYIVYRRFSGKDVTIIDESSRLKTAAEAISVARKMAGIFENVITEDACQSIRDMQPGTTIYIRKPYLNFSIRIKRSKK